MPLQSTRGGASAKGFGFSAVKIYPYTLDFLVVGGGGGGGNAPHHGAGAGAGGYRTNSYLITGPGTTVTVSIGDGGAAFTNGSDSSISAPGQSTISSAGGGYGGRYAGTPGAPGGSGGGGDYTSGFGTGNTPSVSPSQGNNGATGANNNGGGGGGASQAGGSGPGNVGGPGGNGTLYSITGSYYAGGGGGSVADPSSPGGAGGLGGGGTGANYSNNAQPGTANTGGGGGGAERNQSTTGGSGGKGVAILSLPTVSYLKASTTGSPTVSTSGPTTILTYTGSGSLTT